MPTADASAMPPTASEAPREKRVSFASFSSSSSLNQERTPNPSFQPTHEAHYTPKIDHDKIKYRPITDRNQLSDSLAPQGTLVRPNYDDALKRVSVVISQHIARGERRVRGRQDSVTGPPPVATGPGPAGSAIGQSSPRETTGMAIGKALVSGEDTTYMFHEDNFIRAQYKYTFIRAPRMHPLTCYRMTQIQREYSVPTVDEIYRFCKHLFTNAQLTSECTIVCLVYVERLMEVAHVELLACNWRPITLCGLLLASKVWQDLSSWNVEFSNIYPEYPLININRLERIFLHHIRWDLYIAGSVYAKYYFALRSITEKKDFRRRYNYMLQVHPPNAKKLEERTAAMKTELYSTSV